MIKNIIIVMIFALYANALSEDEKQTDEYRSINGGKEPISQVLHNQYFSIPTNEANKKNGNIQARKGYL